MKYHFQVFQDEKSVWAECCELKGCLSEAESREELKERLREALNLYLDESPGNNMVFPLPDENLDQDQSLMQIAVDPEIAFALLLRHHRLANHLTQAQVQKLLNIKNRNSYVRLESTGNPTLKTLSKIKSAFPDFPLEKCFSTM